ncbi:flagellar biosynthetic protein FliO [Massilia sp. CMS3.1]|uniref:flagellar biosynthetic protein FliO n=1 Tax=Massilia sp. CMS3.1 TaxID=3373083 RepID=UPI003EE779AB
MMSMRAPACPPVTSSARALLATMFLLPLAACAMQPASSGAASQAAPAAVQQPATQANAVTPARQQDGGTAGRQDSGAAVQAPAAAVRTTPQNTTTGSLPAPANTPVPERATTVGEVPTVAGTPASPAPEVASMPAAPAAIPGTPANPGMPPNAAAPGPSTGTLLQTIFALVLVLALLAALAWAAKRYGPRVTGSTANLRMVGALNIGGRERIMVIEVGDQWIVVGASPGRVNALATMPKGDAAASAALAGHTPSASNFSDWLKQTIDKRNAK